MWPMTQGSHFPVYGLHFDTEYDYNWINCIELPGNNGWKTNVQKQKVKGKVNPVSSTYLL